MKPKQVFSLRTNFLEMPCPGCGGKSLQEMNGITWCYGCGQI